MAEDLRISDVAALTGVAAGRIRHYEKIGLLRTRHLGNGYRVFGAAEILELLRIDLLRSLGVGIEEIRSVATRDRELVEVLEEHRSLLVAERDRLDRLVAVLDGAMGDHTTSDYDVDPETTSPDQPDSLLRRLSTTHRDSLGVMGRLTEPLSDAALPVYADLLRAWDLPVPALFGQMVLPKEINGFLESLARADGRVELFDRLRALAERVLALDHADTDGAQRLARAWVDEQLTDPLPDDVVHVLDRTSPALTTPMLHLGYGAWAGAIDPSAAAFLAHLEDEVARRGARSISVIIWPSEP